MDEPKKRALLAVLLTEPGRVVPTERLISELWGEAPPPAARKLVSGYVLRLRRAIGDPGGRMLVTQAPGYRLAAGWAEVDAGRFEELLAQGRQALVDGDPGKAAELLAGALRLWRGPPLADVPRGRLVAAEADRLEELRLTAVELRAEACLGCGQAAELTAELGQLTAAYPLRERFWHQLMRVLDGCGRPAEALAAYARARDVLAAELGADPGPDLQQLHLRILAGDRAPSALPPDNGARSAAGAALPVVPHQLPGAVRHFAGRAGELQWLSGLLEEAPGGGGAVVISAIGGTAGVGKTALAVHWAHQVAGQFPDGQLYVNLRGYDPGQPLPPGDALAWFLRALGVPGQDIPPAQDERAARYRSLLAGRRMLIVLDNAGSVEQARPLLPAAPACVTVVTSRDALAGLVARDGARRLSLDLLPLAEAASLLRTLIGERADADPALAAALAGQCARLPLALRVAAELAISRPADPLADLVSELAGQQRRLDLLDVSGDPRTAVRAVFSWSCQHLDPGTGRAFRLLGLHPGPDFDVYATAALTGTTVRQATQALGLLARAHLIQPTGPGRYGLHDLLRAYAAEQAAAHDGQQEGRAALTRLFDHYLHTTAAAMDTLYPAERSWRPDIPRPPAPAPVMTRAGSARASLDTQRASLAAAAAHMAEGGWPSHATRLSAIMFTYLDAGSHIPEALIIHGYARHAARHADDQIAEAAALTRLGVIDSAQDRYPQASELLGQALALSRDNNDRPGQASALSTWA